MHGATFFRPRLGGAQSIAYRNVACGVSALRTPGSRFKSCFCNAVFQNQRLGLGHMPFLFGWFGKLYAFNSLQEVWIFRVRIESHSVTITFM